MKKLEYFKVVLIFPGNVLITIPLIIFFLTKKTYSYNLINLNSLLFYISLLFLILGFWLTIWSVRIFYNHGGDGTPGPWKPVSKLIIAGPYCYVRNPMLMGVFFLLLFESILFSSMPIFYWFLIFFIGNIFYFKNIEEKDLIKRFGEDYKNYRDKVSMFIPSFTSYNKEQYPN